MLVRGPKGREREGALEEGQRAHSPPATQLDGLGSKNRDRLIDRIE